MGLPQGGSRTRTEAGAKSPLREFADRTCRKGEGETGADWGSRLSASPPFRQRELTGEALNNEDRVHFVKSWKNPSGS